MACTGSGPLTEVSGGGLNNPANLDDFDDLAAAKSFLIASIGLATTAASGADCLLSPSIPKNFPKFASTGS